jgi:hypothetical protein
MNQQLLNYVERKVPLVAKSLVEGKSNKTTQLLETVAIEPRSHEVATRT